VSIPWYREPGAESAIVLGFPDWVTVSIACYFAIAILNSIAWLITPVSDSYQETQEAQENHLELGSEEFDS